MKNKSFKKLRNKINKTNKNLVLLNAYRESTSLENIRRCCDALFIPYIKSDTFQILCQKIYMKRPPHMTKRECLRLIVGETSDPLLNLIRIALLFRKKNN